MFRFKLKSLLVIVTLLSILVAVSTQIGTTDAHFEFIENDLTVDDRGRVNGKIRWSFRDRFHQETKAWLFDCTVNHLPLEPEVYKRLISLSPGAQRTIRYRYRELGPLKKQDPFANYISQDLGIDAAFIKGYTMFDGWTEVTINGS